MNQKSPTNWMMTKKNPKASCSPYGSTCQSRAGAWKSASAGETSRIWPSTSARSAIQNSHFMALAMR